MDTKDILIVCLPILTAIVGYWLSKRKEIELKINDEKRKRYENLITYLRRGFMDPYMELEEKVKYKNEFYEQSYVVWLYASDEVIRNINRFAIAVSECSNQNTQDEQRIMNQNLRKLVHAIRKDIKGKTNLSSDEFLTTTVHPGTGTKQKLEPVTETV